MKETIMAENEKLAQEKEIKKLAIQYIVSRQEAELARKKSEDAISELERLHNKPLSILKAQNIVHYQEQIYLLRFSESEFQCLTEFGDGAFIL